MISDKLNNWLTLLANLAVLVGIGVLIIEINQNTQAIRLSSYQELTGQILEMNHLSLENDYVRGTINKLEFYTPACLRTINAGFELTKEDEPFFNAYFFILVRHADMAYFQYESGTISFERLISSIAPLTNVLNIDYVQERWNQVKRNFVLEFQVFIGEQIVEIGNRCQNGT